jgi:hypothetical protein
MDTIMSVDNKAEEVKGKHSLVRFCILGRNFCRVKKLVCLKRTVTVGTLESRIDLLGEKLVVEWEIRFLRTCLELSIRSAFFDRAACTHNPFAHYQTFLLNNPTIIAGLSTICSVGCVVLHSSFHICNVFVEWLFAVIPDNPIRKTTLCANGEIIGWSAIDL